MEDTQENQVPAEVMRVIDNHGRKLATIRTVENVTAIPNSDRLQLLTMKNFGWKVVVNKGEFEPGDKVIYLEIDSSIYVDDMLPCMEFLKERCGKRFTNGKNTVFAELIRIRTIKLRGQISQGLVFPVAQIMKELPDDRLHREDGTAITLFFDDGADWTSLLKVNHYDSICEYYEALCARVCASCPSPDTKGNWPSFVPKTDEERLQGLMEYFTKYADTDFEITEKFDGSSMTFIYAPSMRPDDPFYLCSRNLEKKYDENSNWWKPILRADLMNKFPKIYPGRNIAIQGELVGCGLNGNRDQYTDVYWKVFRIWDIDKAMFLTPAERYEMCEKLGLEHVKVIDKCCKIFQKYRTLDDFLALVEGKTDRGHEREGMVFKAVADGSISFKVINNNYLLKNEL